MAKFEPQQKQALNDLELTSPSSTLSAEELAEVQATGELAYNDAWRDSIESAVGSGNPPPASPEHVAINRLIPHLETIDTPFANGLIGAINEGTIGSYLSNHGLAYNPYHSPGGASAFAQITGTIEIEANPAVHGPGANDLGTVSVHTVDVPESWSNAGWTHGDSTVVNMPAVESLHSALNVAFPEGTHLHPGSVEDVATMVAHNEVGNLASQRADLDTILEVDGEFTGSLDVDLMVIAGEVQSDYSSMSNNRADMGRILSAEILGIVTGTTTSAGYSESQNLVIQGMADLRGVSATDIRTTLATAFQSKYAAIQQAGNVEELYIAGNAIMETTGEALLSYSPEEIDLILQAFGSELQTGSVTTTIGTRIN